MTRSRPRLSIELALQGIATVIAFVVVLAAFWRIQRGVDFTDEGFYVALPARFTLGDRPFADEMNVAQNAGILVWPFVAVYHAIAGFNGIVYFVRVLLVIFLMSIGITSFSLARTRLPQGAAILVGAACIPFMPYGLPGLSYNTLGAGLLALGSFVIARATLDALEKRPVFYRDAFFWAGLAHGASAFAYPSLFIPVIVAAFGLFLAAPTRWHSLLRYVGGGVTFGLIITPLLARAGAAHVRDCVTYLNAADRGAFNAFTLESVESMWARFVLLHPDMWKTALAIAVVVIVIQRWPFWGSLLVPGIAFIAREPMPAAGGIHFLASFGLYAPIVALGLRDRAAAWRILATIWLPSCFAGLMLGLSSGNGVVAVGIGLYPAAMATGLLVAMLINEASFRWMFASIRPIVQLAPVTFVYVLTQYIVSDEAAVYRDGKMSDLTVRLRQGPYRGLLTVQKRREWYEAFVADVNRHADPATKRTFFYYDFPAGYLFTDKRPLAAATWIFPSGPVRTNYETTYFETHALGGELVWRFGGTLNARTPIDRVVAPRVELIGHRDGYSLYRVRAPDAPVPTTAPSDAATTDPGE